MFRQLLEFLSNSFYQILAWGGQLNGILLTEFLGVTLYQFLFGTGITLIFSYWIAIAVRRFLP